MAREIKFRAWNKDRKEWAYLIIGNGKAMQVSHVEGEHEDWQQFTGLKDKNGKEIYDGHIVRAEDGIWEVRWRDSENLVLINEEKQEASARYADGTYWLGETEIIGNIYENPDLLK